MRRKPLFPPPHSPTGKRWRHKGRQRYGLVTVNGRVHLRRTRWHGGVEGSCAPTDALLDVAEATISQGVREMACRLNQDSSSFTKTADNLRRTARITVNKETLRQLIEAEGKAAQRALGSARLDLTWSAQDCRTEQDVTRLYVGCDGVKIPVITESEKVRRRKTVLQKRRRCGRKRRPLPRRKTGADSKYKEFKVVYLYDESKTHRLVGVTAGNHECAGRLLRRLGDQVELSQAQERIANIDGAPWIRNQIEWHGLASAIGLDFYHLQDNAQKARRAVFGEESEAGTTWLHDLMQAFKHAGYDGAWEKLVAWRSMLRGNARTAANQLLHYVAERKDMIRYPEFRANHWQIGSGPTEAECKTTTQRVKGRGRRWDREHAEGMMALAALQDSGLWSAYWSSLDPERN